MPELNAKIANIPIPYYMKKLPISDKGFPVPFFVAWLKNGKEVDRRTGGGIPDFRVVGHIKGKSTVDHCHTESVCWLCGKPLGRRKSFVIGPMCAVNRISSEPPSHLDCARYAVVACPFLTQPRMRRNEKEMPAHGEMAGIGIDRNPGVCVIWSCNRYSRIQTPTGPLFKIGDPVSLEWYAEGKTATRDQVMASLDSGLPILRQMAEEEGKNAVIQLSRQVDRAMELLPVND